jgi:EamA-like transporter family
VVIVVFGASDADLARDALGWFGGASLITRLGDLDMTTTSSSAAATVFTRPQSTRYIALFAAVGPLLLAVGWILVGYLPHSPLWVAAIRVLPAGFALLALRPGLPTGAWWYRSVVLGVVNFAGFFSLRAVAVQIVPVGVAATIAATQTLLVPLGAVFLINTPFRSTQIVYAAIGFHRSMLLSHTKR